MPVQRRTEPQRGGVVPGFVGPVGRGPQVALFGREPPGPLGVTRSAERFPLPCRDEVGEELRVPLAERRLFARGDQLLASILPQRLEQAIACFAAGRLHDHEGLVDQRGEQIEHVVGAECLDRIEGKGPREYGKPAEQGGLGLVEEGVAPVDRLAQRAVAGHGGPGRRGQDFERLVQPRRDLVGGQDAHARGRQLDGERNAVQPPADLAHRLGVRVIECERRRDRASALEKQPPGLGLEHGVRGRACRHGQGRHEPRLFARHAERLAARGEDAKTRATLEQRFDERAQASTRCSQLSRMTNVVRSHRWCTIVSTAGLPPSSRKPSVVATTWPTSAGSERLARSTQPEASNSGAVRAATSAASLVLPPPPTPVSVRSRADRSRSATAAISISRPMNVVS